jgi:hypothetical protein
MQKIDTYIYICASLLFFGCDEDMEDSITVDDLKLNQIQVIGSHNSYRINATAEMHGLIESFQPEFSLDLDYGHPPLDIQFSQYGIRQIEIDIYHDPDGGLFYYQRGNFWIGMPVASGIEELLDPGLKVLHFPDIDYRTHYYTFIDALQAVKDWSNQHPNHIPIFILIEAKEESLSNLYPSLSGFTQPAPFDNTALDAIDTDIRSVFGENLDKVITPDDIRGENESLESVILNGGWPTIGESRGKIYFGLDNGGATRDSYVDGHPALTGRVLFTASDPGTPEAAFLKLNTPTESIADFVSQGYIVRTRADADTKEARSGDTGPRDLAISSGAQFVSTDYYVADVRADTSEDWTNYSVSLPGNFIARENPISGSGTFFDMEIE